MVHYLLSWQNPADRLFDIAIRFTAPCDGPRLLLPVWRPGRYLVQNYAANVREWSATDAAGLPLQITKEGKSSWRVEAAAGDEVVVRYRYYAGVLDAGSSFLDFDEAYFNGSNLFMMVDGLRQSEHQLTLAAPSDWIVETQLPRDQETLVARDYDHLIDSPTIAAATLTRHSFVEEGKPIHLLFRGDEGLDTAAFVDPVRRIVRSQAGLFGGLPFDQYRFLYHVRDRWHGVEHESSSSIILRRDALLGAREGDPAFDHFLSITSHELFHVWNVKRILPERFTPYDYWSETPTRLLWAMEGTTSYFADLTLIRSGLWSLERYLEHLESLVEGHEASPAREHLSLAQASFDGWLSDPSQRHDSANSWFSFYLKGELVSLLLDLAIRRATENAHSLDDVMRLLWNDYGRSGRGLEEDAIERAVARVADVGDFFARYVEGTEPLPYDELFATAGLTMIAESRGEEGSSLGARVRVQDGRVVVDAAFRGGAGMAAGLLPGDEIIALGETRTADEKTLELALRGLVAEERMPLLIARGGRLQQLTLEGRPERTPSITIRATEPSAARDLWLRRIG